MTTGDDGAVKLAEMVVYSRSVASARGLHHPPMSYDHANRLAQAVLTLTAQLQAANVELTALREAIKELGFNTAADAYHNLGGALIDIKQQRGECDGVSRSTLSRVEAQLGRCAAALTRTETTDV